MIDLSGLQGRLCVVTGGASGIGAGIAATLAQAGARVIIADIAAIAAASSAQALREAGYDADHVVLDLADEASIVAAMETVAARHGHIWALINNAGLQDRELLLEGTATAWDRTNSVNSRGAFLMTREAAKAMVAAQQGGRIVHIASAALIGSITQGHAAYAASKAALIGLMHAAALELAPHRITVNTVLPGGVVTPGAMQASGPVPEGPARRRPPLGMASPEDIGWGVLYFVSPRASTVTNQAFAIDGGWSVT